MEPPWSFHSLRANATIILYRNWQMQRRVSGIARLHVQSGSTAGLVVATGAGVAFLVQEAVRSLLSISRQSVYSSLIRSSTAQRGAWLEKVIYYYMVKTGVRP